MQAEQVVLITGAGSGFGKLTAIELARAAHRVYPSSSRHDMPTELGPRNENAH